MIKRALRLLIKQYEFMKRQAMAKGERRKLKYYDDEIKKINDYMKTAKQKGKVLEDYVADQIISKGLDPKARRDGASGASTREKADIITTAQCLGRNLGIEAKNYKIAHVQDWWKQTKKLEVLGREPVLAYKLGQESLTDTKVIIYLDTFLDLLKWQSKADVRGEIIEEDTYEKNKAIREIDFAIGALKKVKKNLNKDEY